MGRKGRAASSKEKFEDGSEAVREAWVHKAWGTNRRNP